MPLLKEENYTIEDIYALPEGERAELIDGQIYYMAPPSRKHQDISLYNRLNHPSIYIENIRIFQVNYMRILKVISVLMAETVRFMRLLLRYIWMKQRIHMLSRIYPLSVILIS